MQREDVEVITAQRDKLRQRLAKQSMWSLRPAAVGLFLLGGGVLLFWFFTDNGSAVSMVSFLAGVTLVAWAILTYFLSPARYLRTEITDGEALSNTINVGRILAGLLIEARGIYLPASRAGAARVFIPSSEQAPLVIDGLRASGSVFVLPASGARGLLLEPPGYGLLAHASQIGVTFTPERFEKELKDVLEKGMELAGKAEVRSAGDEVRVALTDLANAGLCRAVRQDQPGTCTQIGCPICSFLACAVAEGTGRPVRIKSSAVEERTLQATFELLSQGG